MAPRIPRKKGQRANSKKHSDLYTDENPKGTIKGLGFAKVKDAMASVAKIKASGRSHAHKTQAAIAMEQRAREMGKASAAAVYRRFINAQKKITAKRLKEAFKLNDAHLEALMSATGTEAGLKGALLSTLFAIYDAAPSEEAALHTIAVANKMAAKKFHEEALASEATVH